MDWDAIVIGSGLGGLTAGAYLAANGLRTAVLEQHSIAGGNAHVFRRKQTFEFDVGVHYIGDCGPRGRIPTILRGVGLEGAVEFLEMDPDGFNTFLFPDFTFREPKGWDRYRARLLETFPRDEGLGACVDALRAVAREMGGVRLPVQPEDVPRLMREAPTLLQWGFRPLRDLYDEHRIGERARAVLAAESGDYALPPSRVPTVLHAALTDHYVRGGAYYPRGGGQVLSARLIESIRANGGDVYTCARVERILVEAGRARGVRMTDGRELRAPVVISNADLKRTFLGMIDREHVQPETVARIESYRMALPLFCVYLGLDVDLRDRMPNTNYFTFGSYDFEAIYRESYEGRCASTDFAYITVASVKDPGTTAIAPPGCSSLQVMTIAPSDPRFWGFEDGTPASKSGYRRNPTYRAVKERLTEELVDAAERVLPGIRDHIVWRESATPMTQERFTLATGGTSYGIELACDQFGPNRPSPRTEIEGLFLAGASTVFGHGISSVMRGGVGCASAVLGRDLFAEIAGGSVFGHPSAWDGSDPAWDPWLVSHATRWPRKQTEVNLDRDSRVPAGR